MLTLKTPDRNSAYNYWAPELTSGALIVNGPYLVRSASVDGDSLSLKADFNKTATIEIIGVPSGVTTLQINNETVEYTTDAQGSWTANQDYSPPSFELPDLSSLAWYYIDSLPELQADYDDSAWPDADHTNTTNPIGSPLNTSVSLYGSDYGFNTGFLLFRGHFVAQGNESALTLHTQGGEAYGVSAWLNDTLLGSWAGSDAVEDYTSTLALPAAGLAAGAPYVLTVLLDNMGLDENGVGGDEAKNPRGILDYAFAGGAGAGADVDVDVDVRWKITGNLGGEDYADRARGPLNEGGLFVERQGYHQPAPPLAEAFAAAGTTSPLEGLPSAGVAYYVANFTLDLPSDAWDVPLSLVFTNDTTTTGASPAPAYRALLFVNGYQFGRYTSNVGPQTEFPVAEGVLDYHGENWLGVALWALEDGGAKVPGLAWALGATPVLTGREAVTLVEAPAWTQRAGAY